MKVQRQACWHLTLRKKFMLISGAVILIMLFTIGLVSYTASKQALKKYINAQAALTSSQLLGSFDSLIENASLIGLTIAYDERVLLILGGDNANYEKTQAFIQYQNYLRLVMLTYPAIEKIYVYDTRRMKKMSDNNSAGFFANDWYYGKIRDAFAAEGTFGRPFYVTHIQGNGTTVTIVIPILLSGRERIGAVVLNVREEKIRDLFTHQNYPGFDKCLLLDNQGGIVSSIGLSAEDAPAVSNAVLHGYETVVLDMTRYSLTTRASRFSGWRYAILYSVDRNMISITSSLRVAFLLGVLACLIALILFFLLINRNFFHPLDTEMEAIETAIIENKPIEGSYRNDEIGIIHDRVCNLIRLNSKLLTESYNYAVEARDWEMKSLQYQINPHFLYNTLSDVVYMIRMKKNDSAENMLGSLISLYRSNLEGNNHLVPLETELQNLRYYTSIQEQRYSGTLLFVYNLPEHFNEACLPRLVLQPIVENAIYHSAIAVERMVTITISITQTEERLRIVISDDGVGMPSSKLENIKTNLIFSSSQSDKFSALQNIYKRLNASYGENFVFLIESTQSNEEKQLRSGTHVTLELPNTTSEANKR
jgi:two-component system sensor histidine kinase YesM